MVDNCYGEFVEDVEPTEVGADIMASSLMKNLGAGIATSGGYIAGKKDLINLFGGYGDMLPYFRFSKVNCKL